MIEEAFENLIPDENKVSQLVPNHLHREPLFNSFDYVQISISTQGAIESSLKKLIQCQNKNPKIPIIRLW